MTTKTTIEKLILKNLQHNDDFLRKTIPFLKDEYFRRPEEKILFKSIKDCFEKYNTNPTKDFLEIQYDESSLSQQDYDNVSKLVLDLNNDKVGVVDTPEKTQWLLDKTEDFCKNMSLENALSEAFLIFTEKNNKESNLSRTAIPDILQKALGVSFDTSLGHDYIRDAEYRYELMHSTVYKTPCHIDMLNKIMDGGVERKTVNCIAGGTGAGKSMLLCDLAKHYYKSGLNVLYISLEMADVKIADRIDANLLDIPLYSLKDLNRSTFKKLISNVAEKTTGRLIVREYPNGSANVNHFRQLMTELKQKERFVPDVVVVDYMNICSSSRFKDNSNSYGYIKSIAEELRGFAQEQNIIMWTATQLNRDGNNNSDVDIKNISESMGGPMTFDFLMAIISTDDLAQMGQVVFKQLKNRYGDVFKNQAFNVGVDRGKMKFYDIK